MTQIIASFRTVLLQFSFAQIILSQKLMHLNTPKRPISAAPGFYDQSHQSLHSLKQKYQERYQSQHLNNSEKQQAQNKLPLLLLKLKLQELGFRAHQYSHHLQALNEVSLNTIPANMIQIVNAILNQSISIAPPSQIASALSMAPVYVNEYNVYNKKTMCPVCLQQTQDEKLFMLSCKHQFCKQCLAGHIKNSINEAKFKIECMQVQCGGVMEDETVKQLIEEPVYKRYHYFKRKKELEGNPNNKFCSVPNCEGILQQKDDQFICPECKAEYCLSCLRAKHDGDCSTRIQQIIDRSYQDYNIKKCPNCRAPIQKMDGCNHMNCKNCNFQFCWLCLGKYTKYHYRYFNCCGCPGMQFQNEEDRHCQRFKQFCVFLIIPPFLALVLATVIALLPLYMLGMMFLKPIQKATEFSCLSGCCECLCTGCVMNDCCDDDDAECCIDCCSSSEVNLGHVAVGLLMLPYGVLYSVTIAPFKFFGYVLEFIIQVLQ